MIKHCLTCKHESPTVLYHSPLHKNKKGDCMSQDWASYGPVITYAYNQYTDEVDCFHGEPRMENLIKECPLWEPK